MAWDAAERLDSPHVARLLVAGELPVCVALHALQELTLDGGGGRRGCCVGRCRRIPVAGHLLAVSRAEREAGLAERLARDCRRVIRVAAFLAPRTLDRLSIDFGVVNGDDGVRGCFFGRKPGGGREEIESGREAGSGCHLPNECIAFVLEHSDFLDRSERRERLLQDLLGERTGQGAINAAAIDGAIRWAALVVHFVESQGLSVHCSDGRAGKRM